MNVVNIKSGNGRSGKKVELYSNRTYFTVSVLGRSLGLNIKYCKVSFVELNIENNGIIIQLPNRYKNCDNVDIINTALKKMYDEIAQVEIENSMEKARIALGFAPEDYAFKRMKNVYYRTYKNKKIEINPDIVKYNRTIIDNTILKAFCRLKYDANSKAYKEKIQMAMKKYEMFEYNKISKVS